MRKMEKCSFDFEKTVIGLVGKYRLPFLSAIAAGFLAHMFAFTNKLVNADEAATLFGKGASAVSGRWGLELVKLIFPDYSMPWIYGVLTIAMIAVAGCLVLDIFKIKSTWLRLTLPALFVVFPAVTGLMCYMFTSAAYGLSFLLAVLAVKLYTGKGIAGFAVPTLLLFLSLGIYQAYIAVAASFFLMLMIKALLEDQSAAVVFRFGLRCLLMLLLSLALYYAISLVVIYFDDESFVDYAVNQDDGLLKKLFLAYRAFGGSFLNGTFGYVNSVPELLAHLVLAGLIFCGALLWGVRKRGMSERLLMLLCLALFPLSTNCIFLIAELNIIHSLVMYSFASTYVLAAVFIEKTDWNRKEPVKAIAALSSALILLCNTYYSNKVYLKMHIQYENTYAFYSGVATQIKLTEGFDQNSEIAIIGEGHNAIFEPEQFAPDKLTGPSVSLINSYTREYFIRTYLGFDIPFADPEEKNTLSRDQRFIAMPEYPYYGSVAEIDNYIVVKLS